MSTIKSSDEHLTLNADGTSKDIKFQANGVEKASISSAGAFTSTTIDATKLTGTIPNFTSTGIDDNADATAITIDASENVGIGEAAPFTRLHVKEGDSGATDVWGDTGIVIENSADARLSLLSGSSNIGSIKFGDSGLNRSGGIDYNHNGDAMTFATQNTERMRIASTQLLIGATTASGISNSNSNYGLALSGDGQITSGTNNDTNAIFNMSNGSNEHHVLFRSDGTTTGYISTNGSSVAYNTGSDYRLKENVDYDWDATTRLKQLKPARFNFIADDTNTLVDGFIAHEVSNVVPEAISGEKDAMTEEVLYVEGDDIPEGKSVGDVKTAAAIDPQGIDQSKLVPLLVKTIQELEARITALEA